MGSDVTQRTPPLSAGLYLVSTPIGTASDITLRALGILAGADVLAAEDTRNSRKLLEIHGIKLEGRPFLAYHDHSSDGERKRLLDAIRAGKSVAYMSDAGTPLIADPGYKLAAAVIDAGLPVTSAPGASALLAALAVAGLPTDRFMFAGFLPVKAMAKRKFLEGLGVIDATLVFYESPRRLGDTLGVMADVYGERRGAVCRELTKKFEEVRRGTLPELAAMYDAAPKGEIVVVVGPPIEQALGEGDLDTALEAALADMSVKDAAAFVSEQLGLKRKQVYARALEMSGK